MAEVTDLLEQIVDRLDTLIREVCDINKKLNWVESASFANQVIDGLSSIESTINSSKSEIIWKIR